MDWIITVTPIFMGFHLLKFKPPFPSHPSSLSVSHLKRNRMCTPWTTTSPVRCRIMNWASMLCPCRVTLGEERGACSSAPQAPTEAIKKCNRRRQVMLSPHPSLDSREGDSGSNNDPCWPSFADEDYIVFCFGENGTFDVLNEEEVKTNESRSPSRPVNRKLNYGEDEEDHSNGRKEDGVIYQKEREEDESIYLDPGSPQDGIPMGDEIEKHKNCETVLIESGSSNRSDDSAGFFSFPVLSREGIGSPVQMPRTEGLQLRKHKYGLGFRCCRF